MGFLTNVISYLIENFTSIITKIVSLVVIGGAIFKIYCHVEPPKIKMIPKFIVTSREASKFGKIGKAKIEYECTLFNKGGSSSGILKLIKDDVPYILSLTKTLKKKETCLLDGKITINSNEDSFKVSVVFDDINKGRICITKLDLEKGRSSIYKKTKYNL